MNLRHDPYKIKEMGKVSDSIGTSSWHKLTKL